MDADTPITHVAPADQPNSVHELTERLFAAYTVDGGRIHLAGCQLSDRLFVRLTFRLGDASRDLFLGSDGLPVADELLNVLGARQTVRLEKPPSEVRAEIGRLADGGARIAAERLGLTAPRLPDEVAAVWCKFVEGKLQFTVGEFTADLPFSGWARMVTPPPFVCPRTGKPTFHLAATDDGRILDADAVGACAVTGRRMPVDELVTCSLTGKRVACELTEKCSLSGRPVLCSEVVACEICRQRVSPAVVQAGHCEACRNLRPVSKADPRMARLLTEHPTLDRWRKWQLAETATAYVLVASGMLKKLLVVLDKESLDIRLLATGSRLTGHWRSVEPQQRQFVLRE